jgi:hypothetical protein
MEHLHDGAIRLYSSTPFRILFFGILLPLSQGASLLLLSSEYPLTFIIGGYGGRVGMEQLCCWKCGTHWQDAGGCLVWSTLERIYPSPEEKWIMVAKTSLLFSWSSLFLVVCFPHVQGLHTPHLPQAQKCGVKQELPPQILTRPPTINYYSAPYPGSSSLTISVRYNLNIHSKREIKLWMVNSRFPTYKLIPYNNPLRSS